MTPFASPDEPQLSERVDEQFGGVELRRYSKFRSGIIEGVLVVPVVPSLSDRAPRDKWILRRVGQDIVWVIPVEVGGRVDKPCEMKNDTVSQSSGDEKSGPEIFAPIPRGNLSREYVTHVQREPGIALLLPVDDWIGLQIREIHFSSDLDDIGMLLDEQPSHVSEEKSTCGVVRIGIGFREFVVDSVITGPMVNAALVGNGIEKHEKKADTPVRFI